MPNKNVTVGNARGNASAWVDGGSAAGAAAQSQGTEDGEGGWVAAEAVVAGSHGTSCSFSCAALDSDVLSARSLLDVVVIAGDPLVAMKKLDAIESIDEDDGNVDVSACSTVVDVSMPSEVSTKSVVVAVVISIVELPDVAMKPVVDSAEPPDVANTSVVDSAELADVSMKPVVDTAGLPDLSIRSVVDSDELADVSIESVVDMTGLPDLCIKSVVDSDELPDVSIKSVVDSEEPLAVSTE